MSTEISNARHGAGEGFNRLFVATDLEEDAHKHPPSQSDSAIEESSKSRILIIDDVTMAAGLTQVMLAHHGIASAVAHGGPEALEWLREHEVEVVLCDISMPGMNGMEVAREIHARWNERRPKLIAYTAYPREHERLALLDAGFDDFIAKPVHADRLATIIRKWMN